MTIRPMGRSPRGTPVCPRWTNLKGASKAWQGIVAWTGGRIPQDWAGSGGSSGDSRDGSAGGAGDPRAGGTPGRTPGCR